MNGQQINLGGINDRCNHGPCMRDEGLRGFHNQGNSKTTTSRPSWRLQFYSADSHTVKVGNGVKRRGKKSCILREIEREAFFSARMNYGVQSNDYAPLRGARQVVFWCTLYQARRRDETDADAARRAPFTSCTFLFLTSN